MLRNLLALGLVVLVLSSAPRALSAAEPPLSHAVYFTLKDRNADAREKLVEGCRKYLSGHEGTVYFAVGVLAEELQREVNDRDFDVSLLVVFKNKAAHDVYQTNPRHLKFIDEYSGLWEKVRVFDSYLATSQAGPVRRPQGDDQPDRRSERIPLPDQASSFAGLIQGKVVAKREGQIVIQVEKVLRQWQHSRAADAEALVGKPVRVVGPEQGPIATFLQLLKEGDDVT
ncbi:MAG: Dabb family protein, partial [Planctomycetes bacterium]|nr:Dabb family protein [Planctomycetota bacterium]